MHPPNSDIEPYSLVVAVGPGGQRGEVLQLRVSLDAAPEPQQLMKAEGVFAGYGSQESAEAQQLAMLVGSIAGGLGGLAAVLRTFFQRHQHRSITLLCDGEKFELKGMSPRTPDMGSPCQEFWIQGLDERFEQPDHEAYRKPSLKK